MVRCDELVRTCDGWLEAARFRDYAPNGLQVAGRPEIARLACAVTADLATVQAAATWGADALLVHHGWFWKGEPPTVTGPRRARLAAVLAAEMNLIAYHLPLDAQPEFGNNAGLGARLGLVPVGLLPGAGEPALASLGRLPVAETPAAFATRLSVALGRAPLHVSGGRPAIATVAWCTGAAPDLIEAAAAAGADAYVTGEIAERTWYLARELGIEFYAAGHHATETLGVRALAERLAGQFGLVWRFFDSANPV